MTRALILGVDGQDGSYLAELLLSKGNEVIGWMPSDVPVSKNNILHIIDDLSLVNGSLKDIDSLRECLNVYRPDEIYNFASPSSPNASWNSSIEVSDVSGLGVVRLLELIRSMNGGIRFYQASSSELFGEPVEEPQNEDTTFNPRNPYGIAKLFAHWMTVRYREEYGLYSVSGILYNHESPRRGLNFVTRKITNTAVKIKLGLESELKLGNLEARRDWGYAKDYMEAIWLMMHQDLPDDFVIGSGETHSVREFCELAFGELSLDYREFVKIDKRLYRPSEAKQLVANINKAKQHLNWRPNIDFPALVKLMVKAELEFVTNHQQRTSCAD